MLISEVDGETHTGNIDTQTHNIKEIYRAIINGGRLRDCCIGHQGTKHEESHKSKLSRNSPSFFSVVL